MQWLFVKVEMFQKVFSTLQDFYSFKQLTAELLPSCALDCGNRINFYLNHLKPTVCLKLFTAPKTPMLYMYSKSKLNCCNSTAQLLTFVFFVSRSKNFFNGKWSLLSSTLVSCVYTFSFLAAIYIAYASLINVAQFI